MLKKLKRIKQSPLERRMALALSSLRAGTSVIANRAGNWWLPTQQRQASRDAVLAKEAKRFCRKLGELKGSYVKIGQMLAIFGEHILPPELTDALHELEHQTAPIEWPVIEQQLKEQLGDKFNELTVEQDALAAASLGQVHRAHIVASNQQICLKIQYPGIRASIDSDFNDVIRLLKIAHWLPKTDDLSDWLEEVKKLLHNETDYSLEATMTQQMQQRLTNDQRFKVPGVHHYFCSKKVLALEYLPGHEVTADIIQQLPQKRRNTIGQQMLELFFYEIYQWGVMQTDPNFGNYRIDIDEVGNDRLILLDFGAVRAIDAKFLQSLKSTIEAAHQYDQSAVINSLIELGCLKDDHPQQVKESFATFCMLILEPLRQSFEQVPAGIINDDGKYRWRESQLIKRAAKQAKQSSLSTHFSFPPKEFIFLMRKLSGVFSFIAIIGAEFNGYDCLHSELNNQHR